MMSRFPNTRASCDGFRWHPSVVKRVITTFGTVLAVLMAGAHFSALPANADTGCATKVEPVLSGGFYGIGTPANLQWLRESTAAADFSKAYRFTSDINMTGCTWSGPIGSSGIIFSGSLDGAGFKISNLTVTSTSGQNVGLLYQLSGSVTNLTLETPTVSATNAYSGALAGRVLNGGSITNVTVTSPSISGTLSTGTTSYRGGVAGGADAGSSLTDVVVSGVGSVSSTNGSDIGGVVGISAGALTNVTSAVSVSGTSKVGGLVGTLSTGGTITSSSSSGNVTGSGNSVGGAVGFILGNLTAVSASGVVNGASNVGGIAGEGNGTFTITRAASSATVTGSGSGVGGVLGIQGSSAITISRSFNSGAVQGGNTVGGLVGQFGTSTGTGTSLTDSYSTGSVTGTTPTNGGRVGGLVGYLRAGDSLASSYATGAVSGAAGSTRLGGIIGEAQSSSMSISSSTWDTGLTGRSNSGGTGATGYTSQQLKNFVLFNADNLNWNITDGISGGDGITTGTAWSICSGVNSGFAFLTWRGLTGGPCLPTMAYNGNTNTGGSAPVDGSTPYASGATVTVLGAGTLAKTSNTFTGWNTKANGSGTSYADGATFTITTPTMLFAQWLALPRIRYLVNGGSGSAASTIAAAGTSVVLSTGGTMNRSGYSLEGWNTSAVGSGSAYSLGQTVTMPAGGIDLYAQWTALSQSITYGANSGSGSISSTTGLTGTSVTLSTGSGFSRSDFSLSGWNTATNGSGTSYALGQSLVMPGGGLALFAQWVASGGGGGGGGSTPEPAPTVTPTPAPTTDAGGSTGTSAGTGVGSPLIPSGPSSTPPSVPPISWPGVPNGEPVFGPGVAACLCSAAPSPADVTEGANGFTIVANGTTTVLGPLDESGRPSKGTVGGAPTVQLGGTLTVSGSGYQPGSLVTVYAHPGSVNLGTLTVGPNGTVTGSVYIPPTLPSTGVTIQIDGVPFAGGPSSGPISVAVGVATTPPAGGSGGAGSSAGKGAAGLPSTPKSGAGGKPAVAKPGTGKVSPSAGSKEPKVDVDGVFVELADGGSLQVTPTGPTGIKNPKPGSGSSGGKENAPKVQPGGFVEVKGSGLEPGTSVSVWFIPTGGKPPVFGGSVQVGANSDFKGWVSVPKGMPKGNATMQIDVVTKGKPGKPGKGTTVSVGVEVAGAPPVVNGKPAAPVTPTSSPWPGGGAAGPSLPAGSSAAVCTGCAANPPVTPNPSGAPKNKNLDVGGTTVGLGSTGVGGGTNPQSPQAPLVVTPGGFTTVSGSGFKPGTTVNVYANPGKVLLGTLTVGPNGTVSGSLPVPSSLPSNVTIQLDGVTTTGADQSVATGATTTPAVPSPGPLAGLGQGPSGQPVAPMADSSGEAPIVKPGKAILLPEGSGPATPTVSGGTITVGLPTGGTISATPVNDKGNPIGGSTAASAKPVSGGLVGVKGGGFAPGTTVQVWFVPGPIFGGSIPVGPDGTVDGWASVPEGTEPGDYTMQIGGTGETPSGTKAPVSWSQGVTIQPGKGSGAGGSVDAPATGGPVLTPTVQPIGQPGGGLPQQSPGTSSGVLGAPISGGASGGGVGGPTSTAATSSGSGSTPVTTSTSTTGGGSSVTVTVTGTGGSSGGSATVEVTGQNSNGSTQPLVGGSVSAPQGGFINATAGGFAPGTPVTVFLLPSLTPVGTGTVGSNGSVTVTSPVPTGTQVGNGTLQIVGTTPQGSPLAVNLGVIVTAAPSSGSGLSSPVGTTSPLAATPKIYIGPDATPLDEGLGKSAVLFNGSPTPHTTTKTKQSISLETAIGTVVVRAPVDEKGILILTAGTVVGVSGTGALPGSVVEVWSTSGERLLGRIMVSGDGSFSGSIFVPETLPNQMTTLQILNTLRNGVQQTALLGARYVTGSGTDAGAITRNRVVTYFAYNSPTLSKKSQIALREFAALFPTNAYSVTKVVASVRSKNASLSDRKLAQKRAVATKRFLEREGVKGIITISSAKTKDSSSRSRRVISVTGF